jgi:hypothetical protein
MRLVAAREMARADDNADRLAAFAEWYEELVRVYGGAR